MDLEFDGVFGVYHVDELAVFVIGLGFLIEAQVIISKSLNHQIFVVLINALVSLTNLVVIYTFDLASLHRWVAQGVCASIVCCSVNSCAFDILSWNLEWSQSE